MDFNPFADLAFRKQKQGIVWNLLFKKYSTAKSEETLACNEVVEVFGNSALKRNKKEKGTSSRTKNGKTASGKAKNAKAASCQPKSLKIASSQIKKEKGASNRIQKKNSKVAAYPIPSKVRWKRNKSSLQNKKLEFVQCSVKLTDVMQDINKLLKQGIRINELTNNNKSGRKPTFDNAVNINQTCSRTPSKSEKENECSAIKCRRSPRLLNKNLRLNCVAIAKKGLTNCTDCMENKGETLTISSCKHEMMPHIKDEIKLEVPSQEVINADNKDLEKNVNQPSKILRSSKTKKTKQKLEMYIIHTFFKADKATLAANMSKAYSRNSRKESLTPSNNSMKDNKSECASIKCRRSPRLLNKNLRLNCVAIAKKGLTYCTDCTKNTGENLTISSCKHEMMPHIKDEIKLEVPSQEIINADNKDLDTNINQQSKILRSSKTNLNSSQQKQPAKQKITQDSFKIENEYPTRLSKRRKLSIIDNLNKTPPVTVSDPDNSNNSYCYQTQTHENNEIKNMEKIPKPEIKMVPENDSQNKLATNNTPKSVLAKSNNSLRKEEKPKKQKSIAHRVFKKDQNKVSSPGNSFTLRRKHSISGTTRSLSGRDSTNTSDVSNILTNISINSLSNNSHLNNSLPINSEIMNIKDLVENELKSNLAYKLFKRDEARILAKDNKENDYQYWHQAVKEELIQINKRIPMTSLNGYMNWSINNYLNLSSV